jgi:hypothetical protein
MSSSPSAAARPACRRPLVLRGQAALPALA